MKGAPYSPMLAAAALLPTAACSSARPTSGAEVNAALARCNIGADELLWLVDDKGTFLLGPASPLAEPKQDCLEQWIDEKDIRSGPIGYEATR